MAKKILIVTEDAERRSLWSRHFQKAGFVVETAPNGTAAMRSLIEDIPDLILIDYDLPVLSGLEVVQKLRRQAPAHPVKVILVTDDMRYQCRYRSVLESVNLIVSKSIKKEMLLRISEKLIVSAPIQRAKPA